MEMKLRTTDHSELVEGSPGWKCWMENATDGPWIYWLESFLSVDRCCVNVRIRLIFDSNAGNGKGKHGLCFLLHGRCVSDWNSFGAFSVSAIQIRHHITLLVVSTINCYCLWVWSVTCQMSRGSFLKEISSKTPHFEQLQSLKDFYSLNYAWRNLQLPILLHFKIVIQSNDSPLERVA